MDFKKYNKDASAYFDEMDVNYHMLCLVSDTTKLLEKVKYFRNENALIASDIGDVVFRLFALMDKFEFELTAEPFDLEEVREKTATLKDVYIISEDNLMQNFFMEVGVMSNIVTENTKYDLEINADDDGRLKVAIYSYMLQLLILVSKIGLNADAILEMSLNRMKHKAKELNVK